MSENMTIQDDPQGQYWLYRLLDAIELIEAHEICRCDLDAQAPSETNRIRLFLGILQDYADGYNEDGPQPRLSHVLRRLLMAAEGFDSENQRLQATVSRLTQERDEARKDAAFHHDCRPNRRQAEAWRDDAKATNDRWADEVAKNRTMEAEHLRLTQALQDAQRAATLLDYVIDADDEERCDPMTPEECAALTKEFEAYKVKHEARNAAADRVQALESKVERLTQALQESQTGVQDLHAIIDVQKRALHQAHQGLQESQTSVKQLAGDVRAVNAANVEVESSLTLQSEGLARLIEELTLDSKLSWQAWQAKGVGKSDRLTYQAESIMANRCVDLLSALLSPKAHP